MFRFARQNSRFQRRSAYFRHAEGWGGGRLQGAPNFLFDKISTFCVCVTPGYFCSESHPLGRTSTSSVTKTFGTTHVMVSALGSFQTLRIQWFERRSRPAVFARRKPRFQRHRLLRHDEHSVFFNAVSFRSINTIHSALENAQSTIVALLLVLCLL